MYRWFRKVLAHWVRMLGIYILPKDERLSAKINYYAERGRK